MFVGIAVDNIFYYFAFKEEGVESNEQWE
jgi:hypothetical protein